MKRPESTRAEIVEDDVIAAREALSTKLANVWWTFLLRGLLAAAVGLAALFWPTGSISLLLQLVGILLVLDGGLSLFGIGRSVAVGGIGIAVIIIGLVLLIWPEGTARFAFSLLGAFAVLIGVGSLLTWRQLPELDPERMTARNSGFAALLIGLFLVFWPSSGLVALGWAIAFGALAVSVMMLLLASRFKSANERLKTKVINPR